MDLVSNRLMIFLTVSLLSPLVLGGSATHPVAGGEMKGTTVKYSSRGEEISGYLVKPEGKGPFPAVVMIHEWWGLNDQIRGKASELADQGYVVLAVDLYRGRATSDPGEAHELMRGLPEDRAVADMLAAVRYLQSQPYVKGSRIGSIGWCMGGGYSLSLAINSPELAACVIYYGRLVTDPREHNRIQAPIAGFFGDKDRGIPPSSVDKFESSLKSLDKEIETHLYHGAGHAFANENSRSFNKKAAEDSWVKTLRFFKDKLKDN
ncbi:MAG: dienelactone hydrolase family protein [Candidatus Dadabacteria bacterium]|nr:dienelactone hydrolase family protein [Candidatus Dadabacteria bacterium]